jgi:hypothetical protein
MPQYVEVNGETVEFPDGMTNEQIAAALRGTQPPKAQSDQSTFMGVPVGMITQEVLKSAPARFVKGAVVDPALGIAQLVTGGQNQAINQAVNTVEQATKTDGLDIAGLAGAIVSPANKLALASGAGRLGTGALIGAQQGLIQPVQGADRMSGGDFATTKAGQALIGGVLGGTFDVGIATLQKAAKMTQGLTKEGKDRALQDYLNGLAGPERTAVITALQDARELVTGSRPTAAEALTNIPSASELIALQQKVRTQFGGPKAAFAAREAEQAAAREEAIAKIAGTPEQQRALRMRRDRETGRMREEALKQTDLAGDVVGRLETEISNKAASLISATQQQGKAQTEAAIQQNLANTYTPIPGFPRFPGRYTEMAERVPEYKQTAEAFGDITRQRKREIEFLKLQRDSLEQNGFYPLRAESLASQLDSAIKGTNNDVVKQILSETAAKIRSKADENGIVSSRDMYENIRKELNRDIVAALNRVGKAPMQGGLQKQEAEVAGNIKKFIDSAFDRSSDGLWSKYLDTYKKYSQKIDRMRVGEELGKALNTPLNAESAGAFAAAVENASRTIKRAGTDIPRYERLNQLMSPTEMSTINSVRADLTRKVRADEMGAAAGTAPDVQGKAKLPQFLSATITTFNAALDALQRGNKAEFNGKIAQLMLEPQKMAEFMTTQIPSGKMTELVRGMTAGMDDRTRKAFINAFTVPSAAGLFGEQ